MNKKHIKYAAVILTALGLIAGSVWILAGKNEALAAIILKPNTVLKSRVTFLSSLLYRQFSGSAGTNVADYAFYTQAKGGVDDYNNNGTMPNGAYSATWTTCSAANNYCDTGDSTNANKKDGNTGLVWSNWMGSGTTTAWFWANNCHMPETAENPGSCVNNGDDACQCIKKTSALTGCESLGNGWRLPYQKELMQAYIDGSWGNLSNPGYSFWSATTLSVYTQNAWVTALNSGYTNYYIKPNGSSYRVRCVR